MITTLAAVATRANIVRPDASVDIVFRTAFDRASNESDSYSWPGGIIRASSASKSATIDTLLEAKSDIGRPLVHLTSNGVDEGLRSEESTLSAGGDVVRAAHDPDDAQPQLWSACDGIVLVGHLLGGHRPDRDLVADVDADDPGGGLVDRHFVGSRRIGSSSAQDRIDLERRSDPSVEWRKDREVGVDTVDQREHDGVGAVLDDGRQRGDLIDDSWVHCAHVDQEVSGPDGVPESLEAARCSSCTGDGEEHHGPGETGQEDECEDRTAPATPVRTGPECDGTMHHSIGPPSPCRIQGGGHPLRRGTTTLADGQPRSDVRLLKRRRAGSAPLADPARSISVFDCQG